jgi:hypothetical protein
MNVQTILARLQASGLHISAEGNNLRVGPREEVTPETLELIRAHKAELLEVVGKPGIPTTADKDFFRAVLMDARISRYVGADAEDRRANVLAQLQDASIKRAMAVSPDGMVTVGVRVEGEVWTQDLKIPTEKFDPWLILERFEKVTLQ